MTDKDNLHSEGGAVKEVTTGAPFSRSSRGGPKNNTENAVGSVLVSVVLREGTGAKRGNICRSFTVAESRVSEVAAYIERALFGKDAAA